MYHGLDYVLDAGGADSRAQEDREGVGSKGTRVAKVLTGAIYRNSVRDIFTGIYSTILSLPKPIRRVCYVQVFAFMGW